MDCVELVGSGGFWVLFLMEEVEEFWGAIFTSTISPRQMENCKWPICVVVHEI